jgi:hypothetical protein
LGKTSSAAYAVGVEITEATDATMPPIKTCRRFMACSAVASLLVQVRGATGAKAWAAATMRANEKMMRMVNERYFVWLRVHK